MHKALRRNDLHQALALAQQLQQTHPEEPSALTNLATIKDALRHPAAETAELFRRAYALAPNYLFARCGLARCLAEEGSLDEAQGLLNDLIEREEWHRSEYRTYLSAQRTLALARGENETAQGLLASIRDLEHDPG